MPGGTFRKRWALRHAVKKKRVTVQGPVKKLDYMSHKGVGKWARKSPPSPLQPTYA